MQLNVECLKRAHSPYTQTIRTYMAHNVRLNNRHWNISIKHSRWTKENRNGITWTIETSEAHSAQKLYTASIASATPNRKRPFWHFLLCHRIVFAKKESISIFLLVAFVLHTLVLAFICTGIMCTFTAARLQTDAHTHQTQTHGLSLIQRQVPPSHSNSLNNSLNWEQNTSSVTGWLAGCCFCYCFFVCSFFLLLLLCILCSA